MVKGATTKSSRQQQPDLDDMPFGLAGERRRLAMERTNKNKKSLVATIREEVEQWKQQNPSYTRRQHNEKD